MKSTLNDRQASALIFIAALAALVGMAMLAPKPKENPTMQMQGRGQTQQSQQTQ